MSALMIASTSQGVVVLRSEDHGSWEQTAHGLKDWQIMEVAVSPLAPGRLYAGTRGDGVWLSNDYGQTWAKPNYGKPGPGKVQCLTVHPEDPDMVYAGGEPIDTYVTKDAGRNWQRLESVWEMPTIATIDYPVSTVEPHVRDITLDPKDPRKISLALQVGFMLRSDDEGAPGGSRIAISIRTSTPSSSIRRTPVRSTSPLVDTMPVWAPLPGEPSTRAMTAATLGSPLHWSSKRSTPCR